MVDVTVLNEKKKYEKKESECMKHEPQESKLLSRNPKQKICILFKVFDIDFMHFESITDFITESNLQQRKHGYLSSFMLLPNTWYLCTNKILF